MGQAGKQLYNPPINWSIDPPVFMDFFHNMRKKRLYEHNVLSKIANRYLCRLCAPIMLMYYINEVFDNVAGMKLKIPGHCFVENNVMSQKQIREDY